ncbi:hypothetical protein ACFFKC_12140 [Pseudoduganella danionis]|nr:hypothetical protein [Pseudoduganella danionis]
MRFYTTIALRGRMLGCLLAAILLLSGCASSTPQTAAVREFAALAPNLQSYHELTERYRHTYQREQPFLTPEADAFERQQDRQRQQACDDFVKLQGGVQAYMQALGRLAGDKQYDLEDQVKAMGSGIRAWPDQGLDDRHVSAFAGLSRLLARAVTAPAQQAALQDLLRSGAPAVQQLLEAMQTLLRLYQRSSENEQAIVLGMLETELPYADPQRQRLLRALAGVLQQEKRNEYRLFGLRSTLARQHLDSIIASHQALLAQLPAAPTSRE